MFDPAEFFYRFPQIATERRGTEDTDYVRRALYEWQQVNADHRAFHELPTASQSLIIKRAQEIKESMQ